MVKKTDTYARVLRPGESMMLGREFSEFEVILFRPKQHVRVGENPDLEHQAEGSGAGADRDGTSKESANGASSGAPAVPGNKVKFALGPGSAEGSHGDRRKNGAPTSSPSVPNGLMRDVSPEVLFDDGTGSPMGKCGPNAGFDVKFSDLAAEAPLFFDTTVCIFYDELTKTDYVATGRTTADSKGIHYIPHLVVLGDEVGAGAYCNYNITRPDGESIVRNDVDAFEDEDDVLVSRHAANNGPTTMGAADGVSVNMRRLGMCAGFLVCATLFGKDACLNRERNVFYMVRRPQHPSPLCLVPLCVTSESSKSCVSLMVRKLKVHGDSTWEVVNVSEGLALQDVKSVVLKLQSRGLKDPAHFARDFELKASTNRVNERAHGSEEETPMTSTSDSNSNSELDASHSQKRLSEGQEQERSVASEGAPFLGDHQSPGGPSRGCRSFSGLLVDVPRVTREGRRQYNVGRSHVQSNLFNGDTSEEDEVLDDAMRAVVPCYANTSLIRYGTGAYNVGSKVENLVTHYIGHREVYGLDAALHRLIDGGGGEAPGRNGVSKENLPPLLGAPRGRSSADWGSPVPVLDRCQVGEEDSVVVRPELPPGLLVIPQDRRLAAVIPQRQGSANLAVKKHQSTVGRARRSSSLRPSAARKGTSRPPSAAGNVQRTSPQRKKADVKKTRAKSMAVDSAARAEEGRDADGMPSVRPSFRSPRVPSSTRSEEHQAKARPSGSQRKGASRR